jgi:SAM-dependent methyltransferase
MCAMSADRLQLALQEVSAGLAPVPPPETIFVGDGDYLAIGAEFLRYFVDVGGLKPDDSVLDMGSGIGRMASGLGRYLDPAAGRYIGFDPVEAGVAWCRNAYAHKPNFHFEWADLYNEFYRPDGQVLATEFEFPCADASIDFAIATSVFTHLYEPEIAAYLTQLSRTLKPEGRVFATAYLFEGSEPPKGGAAHLDFNLADPDYPHRWHVQGLPPLASVCFQQAFFEEMFAMALGRRPEIRKGRWQGGPGPWFQDLVLG